MANYRIDGCWVDDEVIARGEDYEYGYGDKLDEPAASSESAATLATYGPSYPWLCKRPHPPDGRPYFNSKDSVKCQGCGWPHVGPAVSGESAASATVRMTATATNARVSTVYDLTEIRAAILAVIAAGDPTTPRDGNGKPIWNSYWQLYAAGKGEGFADAVEAALVKGGNNE